MLANELFLELHDLYADLPSDEQSRRSRFLARRTEIKVLVDTIWEQVLVALTGEKPRNAQEARRCVNAIEPRLAVEADRIVLTRLRGVLDDYAALDGSPYIDRARPLDELVMARLKSLCLALTRHPQHVGAEEAARLRRQLEGML